MSANMQVELDRLNRTLEQLNNPQSSAAFPPVLSIDRLTGYYKNCRQQLLPENFMPTSVCCSIRMPCIFKPDLSIRSVNMNDIDLSPLLPEVETEATEGLENYWHERRVPIHSSLSLSSQ